MMTAIRIYRYLRSSGYSLAQSIKRAVRGWR